MNTVILKHYTMNPDNETPIVGPPLETGSQLSEALAADEAGLLYNVQVRRDLEATKASPATLLTAEALLALTKVARHLHNKRERLCEGVNLSEGRFQMLQALSRSDSGVVLGKLAGSMGVTPRNVTGLLDNLERDGLARRVSDPEDRRSWLAELTPAGREKVHQMRQRMLYAQDLLSDRLSEADWKQLRHLCWRLLQITTTTDPAGHLQPAPPDPAITKEEKSRAR